MTRLSLPLFFLLAATLFSCGTASENTQGQASSKKVFRYNQAEGLTSLDPAQARNQANIRAQKQIFNSLFEFSDELSINPSLAETWDIAPDGKTYTVSIKKGVFFHNDACFPDGKGREMTAEDVVYSYKRIIDPATASAGSWIFNDKVLKNADGSISDTCFVALDRYKVRIYLQDPFPPFLNILAMPYTFIIPKEAVEKYGKELRSHPVGTGPFIVKEWDEGNTLILEKNPNYWKRDLQNNPLPYLDMVYVSFIADKSQEFMTFKQKKLDFISGVDAATLEQILKRDGTVREEIAQNFVVQKVPQLNTEYIGIMMDKSTYPDPKHPLLDLKVRQALSYALNREELISFIRNNLGVPGNHGFVPAALPAFDESAVNGYPYNPEKANQLLSEAGYPGGKNFPEITLYTTKNRADVTEQVVKQWSKELGINVKLEINDFGLHQEMVDNGKVQMFAGSWLGDYPDEENYLSCFYGKNFSPKGPNKTRFLNPEYDKLYQQVFLEFDGFKRLEVYRQLDQKVMNDAPVIILFYDEALRLHQKNVTGIDPNRMNNIFLEEVDIVEPAQ